MTQLDAVTAEFAVDRSRPVAPRARRGVISSWQATCIQGYISSNLHSPIRIADLARVAGLGAYRFKPAFKERFGITPYQYVIRKRVERAQSLMMISDDTLREISAECGFADQFHFSNLFHKIVGQRPGAWRRLVSAQIRAANANAAGS